MIGFLLYETIEIAYYMTKGTLSTLYNISCWLFEKNDTKQRQLEIVQEIEDEELLDINKEIKQLEYHLDINDESKSEDLQNIIINLQKRIERLENDLKKED